MPEDTPTTPERIRQAATELFAERGYDGASMAEIADRVGIRKASLYSHYGSKGELLFDLLERSMEAWRECCQLSVQGAVSGARLRDHLDAVLRFVDESPEHVVVVRLSASLVGGDLGEGVRTRILEYNDDYVDRMTRFFAAALEQGQVAPADPRELALFWKAWLDGLVAARLLRQGASDPYRGWREILWGRLWTALGGRNEVAADSSEPSDPMPSENLSPGREPS